MKGNPSLTKDVFLIVVLFAVRWLLVFTVLIDDDDNDDEARCYHLVEIDDEKRTGKVCHFAPFFFSLFLGLMSFPRVYAPCYLSYGEHSPLFESDFQLSSLQWFFFLSSFSFQKNYSPWINLHKRLPFKLVSSMIRELSKLFFFSFSRTRDIIWSHSWSRGFKVVRLS